MFIRRVHLRQKADRGKKDVCVLMNRRVRRKMKWLPLWRCLYHTGCVTVLWSDKCSKCIAFMAVEYYWEDDRCWVLQHIFLFHWEHTKLPSQQRNILIKDTIQTCTRVICKAKGKKRRNDAGIASNCSSNNTAAATGRVGQVGTEIIALSQFSSSMLA